jgi:hypothetical protein
MIADKLVLIDSDYHEKGSSSSFFTVTKPSEEDEEDDEEDPFSYLSSGTFCSVTLL